MIAVSKADQLMELLEQDLVVRIADQQNVGTADALSVFYASQTYQKLHDPATGLYLESPDYLYELFEREQQAGRLIP